MSKEDNSANMGASKHDVPCDTRMSQSQEQLTIIEPIEADETYPSGVRLWMTVISCCTVSLLHGLDLTIVAATVPSLTNHFKTVADIGWYSSAYSLMTASFSFLAGKLYGKSHG